MSRTFYDATGNRIAYTDDSDVHIYLFPGEPVAYLDGGSVYSYSGRHLGWFASGWIRDRNGNCVFFTEDAEGGPMKPMKKMTPTKAMKAMRPMKAMKEMRPIHPMDSSSWSELSGGQFFRD